MEVTVDQIHWAGAIEATAINRPLAQKGTCFVCGATPARQCHRCQLLFFCGEDHGDLSAHKPICDEMHERTAWLERAKTTLLRQASEAESEDAHLPANPFEDMAGYFLGCSETRCYLLPSAARLGTLLRLHTYESTKAALEQALDFLRLERTDRFHMRDIVPDLMLCLDRDQECYDFIKWCAMCRPYDWRHWQCKRYNWLSSLPNWRPPFLDVSGEDVLEEFTFEIKNLRRGHQVPLSLLKIRLWYDLKALRYLNDIARARDLPHEVTDRIRSNLTRNRTLVTGLNRSRAADNRWLTDQINKVAKQWVVSVSYVGRSNRFFWHALIHSYRKPATCHHYRGRPGPDEIRHFLRCNFNSWTENPEAVAEIKALLPKPRERFLELLVEQADYGVCGGRVSSSAPT